MSRLQLLTHALNVNNDGAESTYLHVINRLQQATKTIVIHMFVWRNDHTGKRIALALFQAAQRDIAIHIIKDQDALMYETIEMNRAPLFTLTLSFWQQLRYKINALFMPNTYVVDENNTSMASDILAAPNVKFDWVHHTHHKYYIVDDEHLITGSINIENRHHQYWDYMIEISDIQLVQHFYQRLQQSLPINLSRQIEFVINGDIAFEIKPLILQLLANAKLTVYIEMAYVGDEEISNAIIAASNSGVKVTILFSRLANVGNDINYKTLYNIAKKCSIEIYFSPQMIHSKLMLFDNTVALLGSANLSVYSMQKGKELMVLIQNDAEFIKELTLEITRRLSLSDLCHDINELNGFSATVAYLQQLHQKMQ